MRSYYVLYVFNQARHMSGRLARDTPEVRVCTCVATIMRLATGITRYDSTSRSTQRIAVSRQQQQQYRNPFVIDTRTKQGKKKGETKYET